MFLNVVQLKMQIVHYVVSVLHIVQLALSEKETIQKKFGMLSLTRTKLLLLRLLQLFVLLGEKNSDLLHRMLQSEKSLIP